MLKMGYQALFGALLSAYCLPDVFHALLVTVSFNSVISSLSRSVLEAFLTTRNMDDSSPAEPLT